MKSSKTIYFIRHAESLHNASAVAQHGDDGSIDELYDSPLTRKGFEQALLLQQHTDLQSAEVAVVSPATRTIQTMLCAFPGARASSSSKMSTQNLAEASAHSIEAHVWPLLREHLTESCDIGTGASELQTQWPMLDFSNVPEVWWYVDPEVSPIDPLASRKFFRERGFFERESMVEQRADQIVKDLHELPFDKIACFSHSDLIAVILQRHFKMEESKVFLDNAQILGVDLHKSP